MADNREQCHPVTARTYFKPSIEAQVGGGTCM